MRFTAYAVLIAVILQSNVSYGAKEVYRSAIRLATHKGQAYDANTWDAKVIWYATFFDDYFRRAYANRTAKINHMGPLETAQLIEDQENTQAKEWDFFISMYTKKDYKKFSLDSNSFWQIYLTTGSGEVVWPTAIEQVSVTPYELVMFRHINRWSKCYKVVFPKVDLGNTVQLTLQSIVGSTHLDWIRFIANE